MPMGLELFIPHFLHVMWRSITLHAPSQSLFLCVFVVSNELKRLYLSRSVWSVASTPLGF